MTHPQQHEYEQKLRDTAVAMAEALHEYQLKLRDKMWHAACAWTEDAKREVHAAHAECEGKLTALRDSYARESRAQSLQLSEMRELWDALQQTASQVQNDARLVAELALKMQKTSEDVSKDAAAVRKVEERMRETQRTLQEFPLQISSEVKEQVRGAFEKQERGIMKELAQKLHEFELQQCEHISGIATDMTTVSTRVVETMARDEMRRVARGTLPQCIAAEVARQLRQAGIAAPAAASGSSRTV